VRTSPELLARIILGGHMTDASAKKSEFAAATITNGGLRLFGPDVEMIFASHHKTFDAMMQVNRVTLDGVQAIWCRQLDFIQQTVEGLTTLAREVAQPSSPLNQKLANHAEFSKRALEKNVTNARALTELATKAASDAMNIMNQRFHEGLGEMRHWRESTIVQ
jgi:phasin family protein